MKLEASEFIIRGDDYRLPELHQHDEGFPRRGSECRLILNLSGCDFQATNLVRRRLNRRMSAPIRTVKSWGSEWQTKKSNLAINRARQRCGRECDPHLRTARRFRVTIRISPSLPRNHPQRPRPRATCRSGSMSRHGAKRYRSCGQERKTPPPQAIHHSGGPSYARRPRFSSVVAAN
jgi:hypothetical protein